MPHGLQILKRIDLTGHNGSIYCLAGGQHWLYSGGGDGWIARWHADGSNENGELVAQTHSRIFSLCLLESKNILLAGDMEGHLHWLDLTDRTILRKSAFHKGSIFHILQISDNHILTTSADGSVCLWNTDTFQPERSVVLSGQGLRSSCLLSDDLMASGGSDGNLYFTHPLSLDISDVWPTIHTNSIFAIAATGDSRLLTGGRDARLKAWELPSGTKISDQPAHWYTINAIVPLDSLPLFATASRDKRVRLWQSSDYGLAETLDPTSEGHANSVNALHWNPALSILTTAGDDRVIRLWHIVLAPK